MKTGKIVIVFGILSGLIVWAVRVTGGDLNPGNTPSPTMRTLDELYKNIQPGLPSDWIAFPKEEQAAENSAIHLWLEVEGVLLPGSCEVQQKEDSIRVIGLGHEVAIPYDPATGQVTGIRQHKALIVTKYIDKSSPLLYRTLCRGDQVSEAEFRFYRTNAVGEEEWYYTVRLQNALIINIKTAYPNIEQIGFLYERIEWTWRDGGIIYSDQIGGGG